MNPVFLIPIQIQHLLKLNSISTAEIYSFLYSNTTLVKVKLGKYSNTSLWLVIQIQHLLKLN